RLAAHDRGERAVGDLLRFVQRRVVDDRLHQVDVFEHVRTRGLFAETPERTGRRLDDAARIRPAFAAVDGFADGRLVALDLAAVAVEADAFRIFELEREVVPDFARLV